MNYQSLITALPTQVISFDCFMIDNVTGPDSDLSFAYLRLLTFYVLPVVIIIISFLVWLCKGCCNSAMSRQ